MLDFLTRRVESAPIVLVDDTSHHILEHLVELSQLFDDSVNDLSCPVVDLFL